MKTILVPDEVHQALKIEAAQNGTTIQSLVIARLRPERRPHEVHQASPVEERRHPPAMKPVSEASRKQPGVTAAELRRAGLTEADIKKLGVR